MFSGSILLLLLLVLSFFLLLNNNSFTFNIRIDLVVFGSAILAFCFLSLYFIYPSVSPLLLSFVFMAILYYNEKGNGNPLQYSCLENSMDGGAWWATVHGVAKSRTRLSDFTFTFHFHALEKEIVTHSSVLAWRIPGMGEPGGLPSMGSHRVGHD